ncbi:ferrochelatase [Pseudorhodoferax sp. LjRoot39]|uniref:ferrochelatase n=1 Tax=Pseudorhodoferax sp. LjRoot39 TaxID=3342328 RepID=UPI003ED0CFB6
MPFRPAPAASDAPAKTAVLYCNLGTPDAPTAPAVRRYLAEFLADPRVVEIPRLAWWPILHGIILRVRPAKSAAKYASVWTEQGSALKVWTEAQTLGLRAALAERGHRVGVHYAMRYGQPAIAAQLDALAAEGVTRVLVLQAYPQYSGTTTASVLDAIGTWSRRQRRVPDFRFVGDYHDDAGYIAALADSVERHWTQHGRGELLLMSFHGIPARNIALGDPYEVQCQATARLLARKLALAPTQYRVTFQSRFGRAKWLEPYTEPTLRQLAQQGTKRIDVMCPGFPGDCLETLEEINMEGREAFLQAGGERFDYIPCLNDSAAGIAALATLAERHLQGWNTQLPS